MSHRIRIFTLFLAVCIHAGYGTAPKKIVGGEAISNMYFPHQVSLRCPKMKHYCGGSIIDDHHILTSAQCVLLRHNVFVAKITVVSGSVDIYDEFLAKFHEVVAISIHPDYNRNFPFSNDIAILELAESIIYTGFQKPIRLPITDIREEAIASFSGWGITNDNSTVPSQYLQKLDMHMIGTGVTLEQDNFLPGLLFTYRDSNHYVSKGDVGGGLIFNNEIVGILTQMSVEGNHFSLFTRVHHYMPWINLILQGYY